MQYSAVKISVQHCVQNSDVCRSSISRSTVQCSVQCSRANEFYDRWVGMLPLGAGFKNRAGKYIVVSLLPLGMHLRLLTVFAV